MRTTKTAQFKTYRNGRRKSSTYCTPQQGRSWLAKTEREWKSKGHEVTRVSPNELLVKTLGWRFLVVEERLPKGAHRPFPKADEPKNKRYSTTVTPMERFGMVWPRFVSGGRCK